MRTMSTAALLIALVAPFPAHGQERARVGAAELVADFDAKVVRAERIVSEIGAMAARDQLIRNLIIQGFQREMTSETRQAYIDGTRGTFDRIDNENSSRLREVLRLVSWEELSSLSPRAANDAWSIISHSNDVTFKREMLEIFEPLAFSGRMPGERYANLFDDIAQMEGRPQRYGTNFNCHDGEFRPNSLEDPDRIDERRSDLGMEPLETYAARQRQMYGACPAD